MGGIKGTISMLVAAALALPATSAMAEPAVEDTGLTGIAQLSSSGRWALGGSAGMGTTVIRDLRSGTETPVDMNTFEGFIRDSPGLHLSRAWVSGTYAAFLTRTATGKTKRIDTTKKGKPLTPSWGWSGCGESCAWYERPTVAVSRSSISKDGRFAAFCANYTVPTQPDLYIKNLKTGRLIHTSHHCGIDRVDFPREPEYSSVRAPEISEDGTVVHLRGDGYVLSHGWGLVNWERSMLYFPKTGKKRFVKGWGSMTRDGRTILMRMGTLPPGTTDTTGGRVGAYDLASRKTKTVSTTGTIYGNDPYWFSAFDQASRTGRFVVGPTAVVDRAHGLSIDLNPIVAAAGLQSYTGSDCPSCGSVAGMRRISGNGRVVIIPTAKPGQPTKDGLPTWTDRRDVRVTDWRPVASLRAAANPKRSKIRVDVDPDKRKKSWTLRVEQLKKTKKVTKNKKGKKVAKVTTKWRTLPRSYQTRGKADTLVLNLPKGTYRVRVKADHGYRSVTSATIKLAR